MRDTEVILLGKVNMANIHSKELRLSLKFTIPLMASLLIQTGLWLTNGIMMGSLGSDALAAGALAITGYYLVQLLFFGFINAVSICIGQAKGAQDTQSVIENLQQGGYLIIFLTIPMMLILWNLPYLFSALNQPYELVKLTKQFLHGIAWGSFGMLGFTMLREVSANLEKPIVSMYICIIVLPLSIFLNHVFIHGLYGFPSWGVFGVGVANSIIQLFMFISIFTYFIFNRNLSMYVFQPIKKIHWQKIRYFLTLGVPMSMTYFFEAGLFNVSAIIMGWISVEALAAHQILLHCTEVAFMCFFAVAQTASIRIAHAVGKKNHVEIKHAVFINVGIGLTLACIVASIYFTSHQQLTHIFINAEQDQGLIYNLTKDFFRIGMVFIFFDVLQTIGNNVLRSMKDAYVPMILSLGSYWVIGIGAAYFFGFVLQWNGNGVWFGLTLGIAASAVTIWVRFYYLIYIR